MKTPADRWQTAHDVKMQLQWIQAQGSRLDATAPVTASRRRMAWVPWVVAAVSAALAATMLVMWPGPAVTQAPPARFDLIVPPRFRLSEWDVGAISPDGRRFVFTAQVDGPLRHLVLRDLDSTGVTGDGQRFLGLEPVGGVPSFTVVLNWPNARSR